MLLQLLSLHVELVANVFCFIRCRCIPQLYSTSGTDMVVKQVLLIQHRPILKLCRFNSVYGVKKPVLPAPVATPTYAALARFDCLRRVNGKTAASKEPLNVI